MDDRERALTFSGYLLAIRREFEEKLQSKTGWGRNVRNEVMAVYDQAASETLAKFLENRIPGGR